MTTERTDANDQNEPDEPGAANAGRRPDDVERGDGRPLGVSGSGRSEAEGRPSDVRDAPADRSDHAAAPTEDEVERGGTPDTEHQPGGDL